MVSNKIIGSKLHITLNFMNIKTQIWASRYDSTPDPYYKSQKIMPID